jgi:hypothetical protein
VSWFSLLLTEKLDYLEVSIMSAGGAYGNEIDARGVVPNLRNVLSRWRDWFPELPLPRSGSEQH